MPNQYFSSKSTKSIKDSSIVHQRHLVLYEKYQNDSTSAWITDSAEVVGMNLHDPFRTSVSINDKMKIPFKIGVHKAVGGDHDFPNPGDLLCASLASCFESTIRLIANKLKIELIETKIYTTAQVDVRGTLMIDISVPVEFQSMHIDALKTEFVGVIALAAGEGSRVVLIANVSDSLTDRIQAGKIIQTMKYPWR